MTDINETVETIQVTESAETITVIENGTLGTAPGGGGVELGETSTTAYRGDRGKTAYDHSQILGNPHGTTITQISGLQSALDSKGTSNFSGAYADLTGIPSTFTPSAHNQAWSTITGTPTTLSGYGITDAQPIDSDLTAIAALTPNNDDIVQRKAGVWTSRTPVQLKSDLNLSYSDLSVASLPNAILFWKQLGAITNGTIDIFEVWAESGTIVGIYGAGLKSGTASANFILNATTITGLGSVSLSTTPGGTVNATANNSFSVGASTPLRVTISSASSADTLFFWLIFNPD